MEYHAAVKEDVQVFHELMWKVFQHLSLNIRASCIEERVWIHICLYLQKERLEKMNKNHYFCIFGDENKILYLCILFLFFISMNVLPIKNIGRCFPPWRRKWQPTPVFLPGESHGQRSLAGYSPWGPQESGMT